MISDSNYQVPLNRIPAEPNSAEIDRWLEGKESVVKSEVDKWVNAHHEYYRPALSALAEKIQRVTHSQFSHHLGLAVKNFNEQLEAVEDKRYAVLVQRNKSNQWVTELALKYLQHQPTQSLPLGEKQARDYCSYIDRIGRSGEVIKRIVLIDDASYSGTQLTEHVKAIFEKFKELGWETPTVHVIVPFATQYAVNRLQAVSDSVSTDELTDSESLDEEEKGEVASSERKESEPNAQLESKLKLSLSAKIANVAKSLSEDHVARLSELYNWSDDPIEKRGRGLIYFDHKIPNDMSFVEPFGTGSVYPGKGEHQISKHKVKYINLPPIHPPYKS